MGAYLTETDKYREANKCRVEMLERPLTPFALGGNFIFCRQLIWGEPS